MVAAAVDLAGCFAKVEETEAELGRLDPSSSTAFNAALARLLVGTNKIASVCKEPGGCGRDRAAHLRARERLSAGFLSRRLAARLP